MTGLGIRSLGAIAVIAGLIALPASAGAATIVVNDVVDSNSFDISGCTLRDAVDAANLNAPNGLCTGDTAGADTIVLTGGLTYDLHNIGAVDDSNANGDLDITGPLTITTSGSGLATIGGNDNAANPAANRDRVMHVHSTAGQVTLENLRIQDGRVQAAGAPGGGGILADAQLTIRNSEITGNRVEVNGSSTQGGGIYVRGPLGTLTLTGTTVGGNVVQLVGVVGAGTSAIGGGISVYNSAPFVSLTNSTISGNSAVGVTGVGPGLVGGAFLGDFSIPANQIPATLTSNTITGNVATIGGAVTGGLQITNGTMTGNVVAGNTDDSAVAPDCFAGPAASGGANIIGNRGIGHCELTGPGDLVGTPDAPVLANLGTLLPNGGLTRTHVPNPGSPAIDRGGTCPATDQRGLFRFAGGPCDSGSVEVNGSATPPPTGTTPTPPAPPAKKCKRKKKKRSKAAAAKKCKKKKKRK